MFRQQYLGFATAVLMAIAPTRPLHAQAIGRLQMGAGSATDERGVRSNAIMVVPSVTFGQGGGAQLAIAGTATFFQGAAWSMGGGLAATSRTPIGAGLSLALSADGSGSRTSYNATFATAELTPTMEWTAGPLTVFGGARGAGGFTSVSGSAPSSSMPGVPAGAPASVLVSRTRALYAPVYGARVRLVGDDPTVGAELSVRAEPMHVADTVVFDRTANLVAVAGPVTFAASVGRRTAPDEQRTFGSANAIVEVSHGVALDVGGGRYASNRLTGAAGGDYVTAGLSFRLGRTGPAPPPAPRGVMRPPVGVTRLAIKAPDARQVDVAGDWNGWTLVPAQRADNGVWYADLQMPPGQYRYAFRIDGHGWRVPSGAVAVDDGFGGKSAYVTVRDTNATDSTSRREDR